MIEIAKTWYQTKDFSDDITLIYESHVAGWLRCNMWHIKGTKADLLIDTGMGLRSLTAEVAQLTQRPLTAIISHTHFDHAGGLHQFSNRWGHGCEAEIIANPTPSTTLANLGFLCAEAFLALPYEGFEHTRFSVRPATLTKHIDEGDIIDLGDRVFEVLHLPGHSPGSIGLYERKTQILFSGDAIYQGQLIDNAYHSQPADYIETLKRLKELPVTTVHGGHYESFDKHRMDEMIDEYLNGGRRLGNATSWVASQI